MNIAILIDYDNLKPVQKLSGILDVVTRSLMQLTIQQPDSRGGCDVRIYGGWYEETTMTTLAQKLTTSLLDEFPTIIRIPKLSTGNLLSLNTNAELAVALAEDPSHHIFYTFRKKGKPANIRVISPSEAGCSKPECPLLIAKKLLKTGKCSTLGCTVSRTDLIYRNEQKIVDTMLTCDLLYYSKLNYDHIMLVSGDDDFLPPLRTATLRGNNIYRVHPKPNTQRLPIHIAGNKLTELEL